MIPDVSPQEALELKRKVKNHWESDVCSSRYADGIDGSFSEIFAETDRRLYELDYMRAGFAAFPQASGKRVLEVGLGIGSDLLSWARAGAIAYGVDLTRASVELVSRRLDEEGLRADAIVGDAERLPFPDEHFDIYYSWGVLHHTPDTEKALAEAWRVLRKGGILKLMLYHYPSVFAWLVWVLYGPLKGKLVGPRRVIFDHVESPGTKSFTEDEVKEMLWRVSRDSPVAGEPQIRVYLASPDLLTFQLSRKYRARKWQIAQRIYPRGIIKAILGNRYGTFMTVEALKAT